MNHRKLSTEEQEALSAYYDGEHPNPALLEKQIADDPALAAYLESLCNLSRKMQTAPDPPVDEAFADRIARMAMETPMIRAERRAWRHAFAQLAAAVLLLFAGGGILYTHFPTAPDASKNIVPGEAISLDNLPVDSIAGFTEEADETTAEGDDTLSGGMLLDSLAEAIASENTADIEENTADDAYDASPLALFDEEAVALSDDDVRTILQLMG